MTGPVDALQDALAGEHAAVYAYGVIGGRLPYGTPAQQRASAAFVVHRTRRDALTKALTADGQSPVEPAGAYDLGAMATVADARRIAQRVEGRLSRAWLLVVGTTEGSRRTAALDALTGTATAVLSWGGAPSALPGLD